MKTPTNQQDIFDLTEEQFRWFLAGFIEGEGETAQCFALRSSLCISIKRNRTTRFGFDLSPSFHLYQHTSGRPILERAKLLLKSGSINPKSGSANVLTYTITNRHVLFNLVLPFLSQIHSALWV